MRTLILILISGLAIQSCVDNSSSASDSTGHVTMLQQVDNLGVKLQKSISSFKQVAILDHHRMAAAEGVYTPPSVAYIFSDAQINTDLVLQNQLVGLDLPFKVLCYSEPDTTVAKVAYTSSEFIQKRHGFSAKSLKAYNAAMDGSLSAFDSDQISHTHLDKVVSGYGIVQLKSDFDHETTVRRLREIVMSQGDTKWFANVDYQQDAAEYDIELRPTVLLLFGGPAPGGKAMMTSPKIGLDAFCQKLLVYEHKNGEIWVAYNDVEAFAQLYYGTSTRPQKMISQRLKMTFKKAVTAG